MKPKKPESLNQKHETQIFDFNNLIFMKPNSMKLTDFMNQISIETSRLHEPNLLDVLHETYKLHEQNLQ